MKKILFVIVLLGLYAGSYANGNTTFKGALNSWRWRNHNGNETTATWKAAENTSVPYTIVGEIVRLRLGLSQLREGNTDSLLYSATPNDTCSWKAIDLTNFRSAFMMAGATDFVTQDQATTQQLTSVGGYTPGKIMVSQKVLQWSHPEGANTENEWVFKSTKNVLPNTTYYFKQAGFFISDNNPITYPSLTTTANLFTYTFTGNGNWTEPGNWSNNIIPPTALDAGEIIVSPVDGGQCILNKAQLILPPAKLTILPGKSFMVEKSFYLHQ